MNSGRHPPSPQEYPILGLNLLRLLVQNRIAEFHTELELLSPSALENPCIKHAVELEQSFMEGAYNRVLNARQTVPHKTYIYFLDLVAKTVGDEIAGCSEMAYECLSVNHAQKMLLFSSDQELFEYVEVELLVYLSRTVNHFDIENFPGASRVRNEEWVCVLPKQRNPHLARKFHRFSL